MKGIGQENLAKRFFLILAYVQALMLLVVEMRE